MNPIYLYQILKDINNSYTHVDNRRHKRHLSDREIYNILPPSFVTVTLRNYVRLSVDTIHIESCKTTKHKQKHFRSTKFLLGFQQKIQLKFSESTLLSTINHRTAVNISLRPNLQTLHI